MHEQKVVVFEKIARAIDGIDIVGFTVKGIVDKGEMQGKLQRVTIIHQNAVEKAGRHDDFCNTPLAQHTQLPA